MSTVLIKAAEAYTNASTIHSYVSQGKWAEALAAINQQAELYAVLSWAIALEAHRAGLTQKRIAELLGVSPSALRGIKEEASIRV